MQKWIFCLFIILFGGWNSPVVPDLNTDLLDWETRNLVWTDFKGKAHYGGWEAAVTSYKIGYRLSYRGWGYPRVDVFCQFIKSQSWVRRDAMTDDILKHEQKHFDLAEVYARKMRKAVREADLRDYPGRYIERRVEEIYQDIWNECSDMQDQYDHETRHGLEEEEQAIWDQHISDLLLAYAAYRR
ncbi:MAG: DUF922 domain-containing protein [Bacteroidota bacterium]